jgi:hypothetical protein
MASSPPYHLNAQLPRSCPLIPGNNEDYPKRVITTPKSWGLMLECDAGHFKCPANRLKLHVSKLGCHLLSSLIIF